MKFFGVLFSCLTILGCSEKNQLVPIATDPPVVVIQPKMVELKISPDGEVLPYGTKCNVFWISQDAKICLLNNKEVGVSGSFDLQLFRDTIFSIKAVNGVLTSPSISKNVKIGDWKTSRLGLLTYNIPWQLDSSKVFSEGILVWDSHLSPEQKNIKIFFSVEGKERGFDELGNPAGGSDYSFLENFTQIKIGSEIYKIEKLTESKFERSVPVNFEGKPSLAINYYGRH